MGLTLDAIADLTGRYHNAPEVDARFGLYYPDGEVYTVPCSGCMSGSANLTWDTFDEKIDRVTRFVEWWNVRGRFIAKPELEGNVSKAYRLGFLRKYPFTDPGIKPLRPSI